MPFKLGQLPKLQTMQRSVPFDPAGITLRKLGMENELRKTDIQEHLLKMKQLEQGKQFIPTLSREDYPRFKQWVGSLDSTLGSLLPDSAPENFDAFKKQLYLGADNLTKMNVESYKQAISQIEKQKDRQSKIDLQEQKSEDARILQEQKDEAAMERKLITNEQEKVVNTPTPGVFFNKSTKKFYKNDDTGKPIELTSNEVLRENLKYKEDIPTNDIRVMRQSVPSVKQLIGQARSALQGTITGPLKGRWKDLWSTKIGANDPNFRKLKTDVNLLVTRLMKMHVGARGGQYIMEHFEKIINAGKDTPENLMAALDEIETYANEVAQSQVDQPEQTRTVSERRTTPDGKTIVKYSDGTFGYE